jgi:MFS family permease
LKLAHSRAVLITGLGLTQILAWGSSYYLPAVFAAPIAADMGWPLTWIVGGLSLGLLVAGLVSPRVGRTINEHGGRLVLAGSSVLLALGLAGLSIASSLVLYFAAWVAIGAGMGAGLYDAGFATLGRLYGGDARGMIVGLTLFGGFASTVCWPFSALLVEQFGWRHACLVYAAIHLFVALPIHLFLIPAPPPARETDSAAQAENGRPLVARKHLTVFVLTAAVVALCSVISSMMSVHLLAVLQAGGLSLAAAVSLGALVGPAQVGARVVEMAFGRYYHPIWTMLAATVLVTVGVGLLLIGFPIILLALVPYGAGIGIESIARGTLPLALFGAKDYAALMGRIAMPALVAQAVSPSVGALLLELDGVRGFMLALTGLAALNVVLTAALSANARRAGLR